MSEGVSAVNHHGVRLEVIPGHWEVARPARLASPVEQWRRSRECRREFGHCWHPQELILWWCCLCGTDIDGMPSQDCRFCLDDKAAA